MRESKQEQFRIGGVYRDIEGDVIRLCLDAAGVGAEFLDDDGEWDLHGGNFDLATGACLQARWCTLVPGELTQNASGEWVALGVEKPEALEADIARLWAEACAPAPTNPAFDATFDANAAMIARDGPQRDSYCVCRNHTAPGIFHRSDGPCFAFEEPVSAAKPAISGLQREYSSTHLLGSYR